MLIKVGNFECTEVWDGVFYKALSNYPHITKWEIRNILDFMEYEKSYGRECKIECENKEIIDCIENAIQAPAEYENISRPNLITECTACPYRRGCETKFICHTTSVENAVEIFESGKLLSAVKARGISAQQLMTESRNAAHDPAKIIYVENDCKDIWDWSEKVYSIIEKTEDGI